MRKVGIVFNYTPSVWLLGYREILIMLCESLRLCVKIFFVLARNN